MKVAPDLRAELERAIGAGQKPTGWRFTLAFLCDLRAQVAPGDSAALAELSREFLGLPVVVVSEGERPYKLLTSG